MENPFTQMRFAKCDKQLDDSNCIIMLGSTSENSTRPKILSHSMLQLYRTCNLLACLYILHFDYLSTYVAVPGRNRTSLHCVF